jgi:asparagine synthase (glutamine-hydrolysing)
MFRTFPYDTFLADSRVAACYSRTLPDWKLNFELWGKVAARLCRAGGRIVDANYGWPVDASMTERATAFALGWLKRKARSNVELQDDERPASAGSWPDLGWYADHSPTLARLWASVTPEERDRMQNWKDDGKYLFRVLTLLTHWRECRARRERAVSAHAALQGGRKNEAMS